MKPPEDGGDNRPNHPDERFRAPQVSFDLSAGEVTAKLPTQRILRPQMDTTVTFEVYGDAPNDPISSSRLNLYSRLGGLAETQLIDVIVLKSPAEKYIFRLMGEDRLIHGWEIPGANSQSPYLAFFEDSKRLISRGALPHAHIIIVIKESQVIQPENCILTRGGNLYGDWNEYVWYELDLTNVEEIHLTGDNGQRISVKLSSDHESVLSLVGGQRSSNIFSNGQSVYTLSPEYVRIPNISQSNLHLLRLSIISEDDNQFRYTKHYQLDELVDICKPNDEGCLEIPLDHELVLGNNPFGLYTLRVYERPYRDWQTTFCVVPGLSVSFDQDIYPPYRVNVPDIQALLKLPEGIRFQPDRPAVVLSRDEITWQIQIPVSENQITGILTNFRDEYTSMVLSIGLTLPKIRWRLQGLNVTDYDIWLDHFIEELWLGDWMDASEIILLIDTPATFVGKVELSLSENSIIVPSGRIHDGAICFDLKALEDTLRTGLSLKTISISMYDDTIIIPNIPLFTVRTCWSAEIVGCFYYPEGDTARIDVYWEERGRTEQKMARLWYLSEDQPIMIYEQIVPLDEQETTFRTPINRMRSGEYLVHLEFNASWLLQDRCPSRGDPNTVSIEIVTHPLEKIVTIRNIVDDLGHTHLLPGNAYRIHIIGKVINRQLPDDADLDNVGYVLITKNNENWYVGNLEVNAFQFLRVNNHLSDTNPVKFEYDFDQQIVTSIEDRHGDGAVYCADCHMLFWYQGTVVEEELRNHLTYGPIEIFKVDWETEEQE